MTGPTQQQLYEQAQQFRKLAFVERPYFGSPGAPAQAETNTSGLWGHLNGGMLIGYEYTRWWHECRATRETAVLGDWSWLNKVRVTGPDAARLMNYASVKDVAGQALDQVLFTPMAAENGKVAIEGLTFRFAENEFMFSQSGAQMWLPHIRDKMGFDATIEDVTPDLTVFAVQGPRATEVVEAVTGEDLRDLKFSRWRWIELLGERVILDRQGVTGEIGYELLMPTARGRAHELWRRIREVGEGVGLRELGFKAFMVATPRRASPRRCATTCRPACPPTSSRVSPGSGPAPKSWRRSTTTSPSIGARRPSSAGRARSISTGRTSMAARRWRPKPSAAGRRGGSSGSPGTPTTLPSFMAGSSGASRRRRPSICPTASSACSS
jgi:Aminomethyltransferase folate-binding domain